MEQWEIDRENILRAFNNNPPSPGIKMDKDRYVRIAKEINNRWIDKRCIYKLEKLISQPNLAYVRGLLKYNWPIYTTYDIFIKRYFERDIDGVITDANSTDINSLISTFRVHYNDNSDCFLYMISFVDDGEPYQYKKIGFTRRIVSRKNYLKLAIPPDIASIKRWEIQSNQLWNVEDHIKKFLKPYHKKGEWFKDTDNILSDLINEELNKLKTKLGIHVREVITLSETIP